MKKTILALATAAAMLSGAACTSMLDLTPRDSISDKVMWADASSAEYAVNSIYTYIYDIYASYPCAAGMTEALTDQIKYGSYLYNSMAFIPSEIAYGGSALTANYVDVYMGAWGSLYGAIRRTNEAISNLHNLGGGLDKNVQARLEGELRLMRGWLYFELVKRYKDVILYDEDLTAITKDKGLSTEAEAWKMIKEDLAFAEQNLPAKADAKGRLDKGVAYALASRALLYAQDWAGVIEAANQVEALGYGLESDYAGVFAGNGKETILRYNFSYSDNLTHSFDYYYTPGGDYALVGQQGGGYATPTQEMVESYELATGGFPDWTPWHGKTTEEPPYSQLEPRFQASILYNGASWKGRKIEPYVGGTDGWAEWKKETQPQGRTTTGYYLRKGVDESHNLAERSQSLQPFVILRYGEVLLNKAEACYRNNDAAGANAAVKAIRQRVGLPYSDLSGDELWKAIRQERKVELAFEGLWYWDLRRWGDASKAYPVGLNDYQVHGLKIAPSAVDGQFEYTYVSVDDKDRDYPERMNRFPMPSSELNNNALVEQYAEWK
ncbi:MAG: RagB/SusD family nutrient uptake outer membrane protein [Bacteroidales bacterium]|nr:RagB/SusD family nutrient uptake outer membrane protein [Bacteroidales bacterium]MBQ9711661.1 RagB/SusD family nutrient uptake outer membrane protein [Bacteroidales bacterium]